MPAEQFQMYFICLLILGRILCKLSITKINFIITNGFKNMAITNLIVSYNTPFLHITKDKFEN